MDDMERGEFLYSTESLESKDSSHFHIRSEHHKLDVLSSEQINRLAFINYTILAFCFLYTVVTVVLANTSFRANVQFKYGNRTLILRSVNKPFCLMVMQKTFPMILFAVTLPFALVYTIRVCRNKRSKPTSKQIFVISLMWASLLDNNPIPPIKDVHDRLIHYNNPGVWLINRQAFYVVYAISWFLRQTAFSFAQGFYIWAVAHSYRLPDGNQRGWRFYVPKIIPFILHSLLRLYAKHGFQPKILTSSLMFTTAASAISLTYRLPLTWGWEVKTILSVFTLLEAFIFVNIVLQIFKTSRALHKLDYAKHRSRQIGFRFFVSQSLFYFGWSFTLDCVRRLAIPALHALFYYKNFKSYHFENSDFDAGIKLMHVTFVLVTAYAHLPPDSVGVRGWFRGAEEAELHRLKPIKLVLHGMKGKYVNVQYHANTFSLPTATCLFNFAWLVYNWETEKHGCVAMTQRTFQFKLNDYVSDEATDTHVLVVDGIDRIILAFRGTASYENIKTDLQFSRSQVSSYLPTYPDVQHEMMNGRDWNRATAHTGFLKAYRAVSEKVIDYVEKLLKKNERPIFLTGHSLGGALATICSLDLLLSLRILDVAVFTFGSPKVGNHPFVELCNRYIPAYWRVSVAADIVTTMPRGGYRHCGKLVFITHGGDMFLDPNVLEMRARSRAGQSAFFHKKSSYKIGLLVIADKYSDAFQHEIWNFRISKKDTAKWEKLMMKEDGIADIVDFEDEDDVEAINTCATGEWAGIMTI